MSADIDGSPHLDEHIASDSLLFSPVHALRVHQEVPDSDNDESLEQLAERQEQEYWSRLGVEDEPIAYTSSPRSATPFVTSKRARSRSPLVYDPDNRHEHSESPLPSLLSRQAPRNPRSATPQVYDAGLSGHDWSPSMSPDPLVLPMDAKTLSKRRIRTTTLTRAADEGYQTRTDSDHVTSLRDVSAEPEQAQETANGHRGASVPFQRSRSPIPCDLGDLPPPLTTRNANSTRKVDDRSLSSPLSSPITSPAALPPPEDQPDTDRPGSLAPDVDAPMVTEEPHRESSVAPLRNDDAAPVRQFRQRKAVQLAPYSTEFSKFASIATKNDWQAIVTAGLRQAFVEKEKAKSNGSAKKQRNPSDEWLVHGNEEEEEDDSAFSEPSSEPTSPRRKRRATPQSDNDNETALPATSVERYSRSHKEKERDPIADRLKAARKYFKHSKNDTHSTKVPHASTSNTTLEDLERVATRKSKSSRRKHHQLASHDGAARAAQMNRAKIDGLLPSDVGSSSSEDERRKSRTNHLARVARSGSREGRRQPDESVVLGSTSSSSNSESESEGAPASDSPDRPIANSKDRFTLKGKRKRAAMFMMPAVALKRAEADLRLMEREMEEGKQIRLEEIDNNPIQDGVAQTARAKKRWAPRNSDQPFRYVIDLSTGESESESEAAEPQGDAGNDETQAAMKAWTSMAAGRAQYDSNPRRQDSGYWDKVIGRILVRKDSERRSKPARRRTSGKRSNGMKKTARPRHEIIKDPGKTSRSRAKQSDLHQHFEQPVYLDSAERLYDVIRAGPAALRPPCRIGADRNAFWEELAVSKGLETGRQDTARAEQIARVLPQPHQPAANTDIVKENGSARFARFSFDYNIKRLPSGLCFGNSTYIGKGHLYTLVQDMKLQAITPALTISPFGIGLDSTMASEVLLEMLPRIVECIYEYAVGESPSSSLDCPAGQTLRFLTRYAMLDHTQNPNATTTRTTIFAQLKNVEARLDQYVLDTDTLDHALSTTLVSFRWAMLELSILAYAQIPSNRTSAASESAKHRILEGISDLVSLLLRSGAATAAKRLIDASFKHQRDEADATIDSIFCEAWVCLINVCASGQAIKSFDFLTFPAFWRIIEHRLTEEAIEHNLHPIVRGEVSSCTCMLLCALSQITADGECRPVPQLHAHWPLITKSLDSIKVADFAESYNMMSTANRTRTSRYIWTLFARSLTMASTWNWGLLDQGKIIGKMFDILNSRQLEDFCIDGEADFPGFLSTFNGQIDTQIAKEDTAFHIFLRILAQVAAECEIKSDDKAKNFLARIAMRIMPMREHLPYSRHASAASPVDRSVLVNHCALLVVLAAVDATTSDRSFAKLKTILDFSTSDTRARQDYLKGIMFVGIVYKVRGMDLSAVLSWLTHTADYLCQTYCRCARRRAALLSLKRKTILTPKTVHQPGTKPGLRHGSTPAVEVDREKEMHTINNEMGETAILEGLLLGAVQQIMLTRVQATSESAVYPSLEYLNNGKLNGAYAASDTDLQFLPAWILQVLSSPMARDPVAGSQVLQCLQRFIKLRNDCIQQGQALLQGESQDEYGDMDFDYDDPALNVMLGIPDVATESTQQGDKSLDVVRLDQDFVELLKVSISPRLYSIISDLSAIHTGQDTGVPEFPHKKAYVANVVDLWASCASILVQKSHRDWKYYIEPFGKESWQRLADIVGRFEIGSMFCESMLTSDGPAYKANRDILLEVGFRRLAAPSPGASDAKLFTRLLNADPALLLWQNLPFQLEELVREYVISLDDYKKHRMTALRAIFANCNRILAKGIIICEGIERSCAAVCREQQLNDTLVHRLLGLLFASMRDFLDAMGHSKDAASTRKEYAAFCRQVVLYLKEELDQKFATEQTIPALRLLAGVINGTSA